MGSHLPTIVLVALTFIPDAPIECVNAARAYAAIFARVTDALRAYEQCLTASRARNQCAEEFDNLDDAQRDFEDAVTRFEKACPPSALEPH
jgi:hypothetical protein